MAAKLSGNFRKASDAPNFPYAADTTPFILIADDGQVYTANKKAEKLVMINRLDASDVVLAVWPGQYRTDVFVVDDLSRAIEGL